MSHGGRSQWKGCLHPSSQEAEGKQWTVKKGFGGGVIYIPTSQPCDLLPLSRSHPKDFRLWSHHWTDPWMKLESLFNHFLNAYQWWTNQVSSMYESLGDTSCLHHHTLYPLLSFVLIFSSLSSHPLLNFFISANPFFYECVEISFIHCTSQPLKVYNSFSIFTVVQLLLHSSLECFHHSERSPIPFIYYPQISLFKPLIYFLSLWISLLEKFHVNWVTIYVFLLFLASSADHNSFKRYPCCCIS